MNRFEQELRNNQNTVALIVILAVVAWLYAFGFNITGASASTGKPTAVTTATTHATKTTTANPAKDPVYAAIVAGNGNNGIIKAGNPQVHVSSGTSTITLADGTKMYASYDQASMAYSGGAQLKVQVDGTISVATN